MLAKNFNEIICNNSNTLFNEMEIAMSKIGLLSIK